MKISKWLFIIVLVGSYPSCYWDYHLSNYLFEQYCNEEGRTGQFIYERVGLGEEYFIPIPKDERELIRVDNGYFIDDKKLLIDKHQLLQNFIINTMKKTMLSPIGPIYTYETTIVRKSDGKVLSKAVSLMNEKGWWSRQSILGTNVGDVCPKYRDVSGHINVRSDHSDVFRNTFYKN
tara:strand:+ start:1422 stop:1952 length:531 start_codon:yes stop_codon:yes gene_type:complete